MRTCTHLTVLLVLGFYYYANAHNWETCVPSRNYVTGTGNSGFDNGGSTSVPCDPLPPGTTSITYQNYQVGSSIDLCWTTNHETPPPHCFVIASASEETTLETKPCQHSFDNPVGATSIPLNMAPGKYIVQYRWGTWRNCIDVQLFGNPPVGAISLGDNLYSIPAGKYNAVTGETTCDEGHVVNTEGQCAVTFGRYFGVVFGLAILFTVIIFLGYVAYLRIKRPEKFNQHVARLQTRCSGNGETTP